MCIETPLQVLQATGMQGVYNQAVGSQNSVIHMAHTVRNATIVRFHLPLEAPLWALQSFYSQLRNTSRDPHPALPALMLTLRCQRPALTMLRCHSTHANTRLPKSVGSSCTARCSQQ